MKFGSSDRRKEEIEQFKSLVLDTALELMAETKNWSSVSVNKIGAKIRYTPANIYHYFKNKDDILYHLTLRGIQIIRGFILDVLERDYEDITDKVIDICSRFWDFGHEHEEIYIIIFLIKHESEKLDFFQNRMILIEEVKKLFPYDLNEEEYHGIYEGILCIFHGYMSMSFNQRLYNPDIEKNKEAMKSTLRFYIKGLKSQFE